MKPVLEMWAVSVAESHLNQGLAVAFEWPFVLADLFVLPGSATEDAGRLFVADRIGVDMISSISPSTNQKSQ
jgi:hypothetical protein